MAHPEDYIAGKTGTHPKYDQGQTLGSYRTSETQFQNPKGINVFEGFGADKDDLVRGWCQPNLRELPNYDTQTYFDRWTLPKADDLVEDGPGIPRNKNFLDGDRVSKGFLTRPRIPTER